jgi:curved DNA-binding protein
MNNPYEILGIQPNATPEEIKSAFRSKAKLYHPDLNSSPEAKQKFQEVQNAYDAIKDGPPKQDMFNDSAYRNIWEFFQEANHMRQQRNHDLHVQCILSLEQAYNGTELTIEIDGKVVVVAVPPGIDNGNRLRVAGASKNNPSLPPGDVYVITMIKEHPIYKRDGSSLYLTKEVDVMELLLRKPIKIQAIDGSSTEIKIPDNFKSSESIRIPQKGMKMGTVIGDLLVQFVIKFSELTESQKQHFEIDL